MKVQFDNSERRVLLLSAIEAEANPKRAILSEVAVDPLGSVVTDICGSSVDVTVRSDTGGEPLIKKTVRLSRPEGAQIIQFSSTFVGNG
jgi:hypothetical protein